MEGSPRLRAMTERALRVQKPTISPSRNPGGAGKAAGGSPQQPWEMVEEPRAKLSMSETGVNGHPFDAELDVSELDDRLKPGPAFPGRAAILSRSHLVLLSRRMTYRGRLLLIAIHLIDDTPTPLFGVVESCEYHGDGQHRIVLSLKSVDEVHGVTAWVHGRRRKG